LLGAAGLVKEFTKMGIIGAILKNPEDLTHLLKLKMASMAASRAIPADPNLAFCYQMLGRVTPSFSVVIQALEPNLRNAVSIFAVTQVPRNIIQ
jgi:farnesyl-diphosphate farnesyltransferase